ncbi:MAG TPA: protein kinase [Gemmatimonadaceae bacterium]|nr:protein kinase [Gemmatimonadaceae bacterium]
MDPIIQRLRDDFAGRYEIESELGRGGMAAVYLANDLRHDRRVALKLLRADVSGAEAGERFLREIRTVARLHHPHIVPLYDSGTVGDHLFYVMPYIEGETVRERLDREGPLPVDEAVRITREVADALEFAHGRGVVHRDIKPENIFLSAGHAAVSDFGIARAADKAGIRLTEAGMAVGTPAYMSPEQATADPNVDGRADQYALACVLYEMLAGQPPFTGATARGVMARHATDRVPPLSTVREVHPALESAVVKALSKAPADRWPSARAFGDSLDTVVAGAGSTSDDASTTTRRKWTWAAAGMGAGAVGALLWAVSTGAVARSGSEPLSIHSVAVLPFSTTGDTAQSVIADGMTEGLITSLVRVEGLRIPSSGRTLAYRDRHDDPRVVGEALDVSALVTGGVQVAGNNFRVTAQLTRTADGVVLWREQFNGQLVIDGQLRDLFTIQDEITGRILGALLPKLAPAKRAAFARGVRTADPEAWKMYLQARRIGYNLTEGSTAQAQALLERAIARDSTFSDAWAALVPILDFAARFSTEPPEHFNAAIRRAANRAVDLDSLNGFAYTQRAWVRALQDWDWDGAQRDMRKAVRLSPGSADVLRDYAGLQGWMNRPDSVMAYARRSFDSTAIGWDAMAWAYAQSRMPDSALAAAEQAIAADSNFVWGYLWLAMYYLDAGRRGPADSAITRFLAGAGNDAQGIGWASVYYRRAGDANGARAMLARLTAVARQRSWGVHSAMSMVRLSLGERDAALDELEEAARRREYLLPATLTEALAPLQREPRHVEVRRTVFGNRTLPPPIFP